MKESSSGFLKPARKPVPCVQEILVSTSLLMNFQHSAFHKVVDTFIRQVLVSKFGVKEDCQFGSLPSARAMVSNCLALDDFRQQTRVI